MDTLRTKYSKLTPDSTPTLWELIEKVGVQAVNTNAGEELEALLTKEGLYVQRAVGEERAPRKAKEEKLIDLSGEEHYERPNGQLYYARKWGIHTDVPALRKAREATTEAINTGVGSPMFTLIYGAPGCGKTALVEAAFGKNVRTLVGNGDVEVADMIGSYVQMPDATFQWVDGDLIKCAIEGSVYFIDEIGLIDPKVLAFAYALMDGRRELIVTANPLRGTIVAHPDFYVVAATNPNAPGVRLSEALLSRFTVQAEMTTDWALAVKLGVHEDMVTVAQNLHKKRLDNLLTWSPQMRELIAFRDIAKTFGNEFAMANLISVAPEQDRPTVSEVMSLAFGVKAKPAKI